MGNAINASFHPLIYQTKELYKEFNYCNRDILRGISNGIFRCY